MTSRVTVRRSDSYVAEAIAMASHVFHGQLCSSPHDTEMPRCGQVITLHRSCASRSQSRRTLSRSLHGPRRSSGRCGRSFGNLRSLEPKLPSSERRGCTRRRHRKRLILQRGSRSGRPTQSRGHRDDHARGLAPCVSRQRSRPGIGSRKGSRKMQNRGASLPGSTCSHVWWC